MFPAVDLTPCVGIHSVPPSSFVLLRPGRHTVSKYWNFDPRTKSVTALRLNTRSTSASFSPKRSSANSVPIDLFSPSSAVAGTPRPSSAWPIPLSPAAPPTRLASIPSPTYDDSEPNWNERPYFTKVEEKRGRTGWHVNVGAQDSEKIPAPEPPPESLTAALCQLPATMAALLRNSGCVWPRKEIASCFPASVATKSWAVCPHPRPNLRIFSQEHNSALSLIS